MCGIAGVVSLDHQPVPHLQRRLEVMSELLAHRGPDGHGFWTSQAGDVGLAHRRLSIIDPTPRGAQPMTVGPHIMIHNGEIYNYLELRHQLDESRFFSESDTETILRAYDKWGDDFLDHLRGMFAFALWDDQRKRLLLARDRFGIKPLYYFQSADNHLYFASEVKALLPFLPKIETDVEGLRDYLVFQYPLEQRTLFSGVRQVPPAHVITAERGRVVPRRYWELFYERDFNHSDTYFITRTRELLEDAIAVHVRADVPIGAYVSGGIDSSLVASLGARKRDVLCFTGFVDEGDRFDERKHARSVTGAAGLELLECQITADDLIEHLEDIVYYLDYPVAGPGVLPQYLVSQLAARHRKVMLGGQGGDEIFGGYVRYLLAYFEQCIKGAVDGTLNSGDFIVTYQSIIPNLTLLKPYVPMMRSFFADGLFGPMDQRYLKLVERGSLLGEELRIDLREPYDPHDTFLRIFNAENVEKGSLFDSMTHVDFKTLLPALLHVEDRVGMAHGLESRVPLLDHPLVEFAATMPADVKFKDGTLKRVLRKVATGVLPDEVISRTDKMGFPIPLVDWLRSHARDWALDLFRTGATRDRDYVDSARIAAILEGEHTFGRTIWGYLNLELWHQRFHDRSWEFRSMNPDATGASTDLPGVREGNATP